MNHNKKNPSNKHCLILLCRDPIFWISISSAVLFWFILKKYTAQPSHFLWPMNQPVLFLWLVLLYPVVEEIIFRGIALEFLHKHVHGNVLVKISKANIISSLLFAALHFIYHSVLWASAVFIPSLMFGYFKEKYNNLLPPILLHIFFNAGYYWIFGN